MDVRTTATEEPLQAGMSVRCVPFQEYMSALVFLLEIDKEQVQTAPMKENGTAE